MRILRAHTVDPKKFEEVARQLWTPFVDDSKVTPTTFQAHPDAFRFEPQGARVHIAVAPLPDRIGSVWVPEQADNINGLGIIFAVGPEVFYGDTPHPGAVTYDMEEMAEKDTLYDAGKILLYRQVMLKKYSGTPLAFDNITGHDYYDNIITCALRDILAVDFPENRPAGAETDGLRNMLGQQLETQE